MSGTLAKHDVAQVAATSQLMAEVHGMSAQLKTWYSMEAYATQMYVSGRSKEDKGALEQAEKTAEKVDNQ